VRGRDDTEGNAQDMMVRKEPEEARIEYHGNEPNEAKSEKAVTRMEKRRESVRRQRTRT